jgi:hypothetical protein
VNSYDPSAWQPALRRALISARPDFFGLSAEEQLRYRVKPDNDEAASCDLPAESATWSAGATRKPKAQAY